MNRERRKKIEDVIAQLQDIQEEVSYIASEEREAFENLPEGIQYSERGEAMEENADSLDEVDTDIDNLIDALQDIIDR